MPFGNSRIVSRTIVPEGHRESSPAFQRREGRAKDLSPEGTAERETVRAIYQPSLRDLVWSDIRPSVETLDNCDDDEEFDQGESLWNRGPATACSARGRTGSTRNFRLLAPTLSRPIYSSEAHS